MHAAMLLAAAALSGSLSGTVLTTTGTPVDNYRVDLYDAVQTEIQQVCTAPDGTYGFAGLPAGTYYVNFSGKEGCGPATTLAPTWWNNHFSMSLADPVTVTDANETTKIDAALGEGAQILGRVVDADSGKAVEHVAVEVRDVSARTVGRACTAADGTYHVDRVIAGVMTVVFISDSRCGAVAAYPTQYYLDADSYPSSAAVNVAAGQIVENIDGHLRLPRTPALTPTPTPTPTVGPIGSTGEQVAPVGSSGPAPSGPVVSTLKLSRAGTLSLRLSTAATVRIKVERSSSHRWHTVKRIARPARAGAFTLALKPGKSGRYRVSVTATAGGLTSPAAVITGTIAVKRK